ncbi:hypothetical protein [Microbacterium sp. VKM Ac-2923]|uniref:hypothetical protein n=1 Tax=Microbacterium sp. VKM Ac-2923 TaxID=2929476 RepID=UPI001FB294BF|nr:hypothetical protein [Microbacterium sp. VKM Ac-2923]MCJ1706625.1 hypothetical protein [Microbacterium sp. VKM Ac-2923]
MLTTGDVRERRHVDGLLHHVGGESVVSLVDDREARAAERIVSPASDTDSGAHTLRRTPSPEGTLLIFGVSSMRPRWFHSRAL